MPKQTLTSMSVDALLKLREDVSAALNRRADALRQELRSIGKDYADVGRIALYGKSKLAGRKVEPKYRGPNGELWSGRGALPRWMAAQVKAGRKREDFLIASSANKATPTKRPGRKRAKPRKKKK